MLHEGTTNLSPESRPVIPLDLLQRLWRFYSPSDLIFDKDKIPEIEQTDVAELSLISHGMGIEWMLGYTEKGMGILQEISKGGLGNYLLAGKGVSSRFGINYQGATNATGLMDQGEELVAFESNALTGYGSIFFVMPTALGLRNGGVITSFQKADTRPGEVTPLGGLSGHVGEIDIYTPYGMFVNRMYWIDKALDALKGSNTDALSNSAKEAIVMALPNITGTSSSDLERYLLGDPSQTLSTIEADLTRMKDELSSLEPSIRAYRGIDLLDPFIIYMVGKDQIDEIKKGISILPVEEMVKTFMMNQIIPYDDTDETFQTVIAQFDGLRDIREYAQVILPNIRLFFSDPDINTDDVVDMLTHIERSIAYGSTNRLKKGGYAVLPC